MFSQNISHIKRGRVNIFARPFFFCLLSIITIKNVGTYPRCVHHPIIYKQQCLYVDAPGVRPYILPMLHKIKGIYFSPKEPKRNISLMQCNTLKHNKDINGYNVKLNL